MTLTIKHFKLSGYLILFLNELMTQFIVAKK